MQTDTAPMFARQFVNDGHVHTFLIASMGRDGWEVREEHDSRVVRHARYRDWHRVERARNLFSLKATLLSDEGWVEA